MNTEKCPKCGKGMKKYPSEKVVSVPTKAAGIVKARGSEYRCRCGFVEIRPEYASGMDILLSCASKSLHNIQG